MNRDLDEQLNEMGEEYRTVVGRLKAAYAPVADGRTGCPARSYLVAASLAILLGLGIVFSTSRLFNSSTPQPNRIYTVRATDAATEYSLAYIRNDEAVKEMIRTQNPDGGWKNDFLTRQNAEALKRCASPEAQVAYKKALRNLRAKGAL